MSIPPEGTPTGNDDADPTGMRDVLSSLPEPGPMPEDLADRICASLEREQGRRAEKAWDSTAPIHDLAHERSHRRPQQWILAAAAVVAVGVIGTVVFDDLLGSGSSGDSPAAALSSPANEESGSDSGTTDLDSSELLSDTTLQSVDDDAFAVGAQSLLEVASGQPAQDPSNPALGLSIDLDDVKALDDDELDRCVAAAGFRPTERSWVGAPTAVNGEEVVILGSTGSEDPHEAWALDRTCPENSEAGVLKGPVSLP